MGIATALAIGSLAVGAGSAVMSYSQSRKAEKQQRRANAAAMAAAEEEARLMREDAAYAAGKEREEAAKLRSRQLALYLKSGVTLDGTPMLVASDTTEEGEENAQNLIANAESQANSTILRGQAGQQAVQRADFFGTASTVLGAGAQGVKIYKASKAG